MNWPQLPLVETGWNRHGAAGAFQSGEQRPGVGDEPSGVGNGLGLDPPGEIGRSVEGVYEAVEQPPEAKAQAEVVVDRMGDGGRQPSFSLKSATVRSHACCAASAL